MGKYRQTIRLYRSHDLDLITFMETHEFNITKAIYCSLKAFSNNDYFVIEIPPKRKKELDIKRNIYTKQLSLDEEKDAEAIRTLLKIKNGGKNNFLKNLLRMYLCHPIAESFLVNEEEITDFTEKFEKMKKNHRRANAGELKLIRKNRAVNNINAKKDTKDETVDLLQNKTDKSELPVKQNITESTLTATENKTKYNNTLNETQNDINDDELLDLFSSLI